MSFDVMEEKLKRWDYVSTTSFKDDLLLLFQNAVMYNPSDSSIHERALEYRPKAVSLYERAIEPFKTFVHTTTEESAFISKPSKLAEYSADAVFQGAQQFTNPYMNQAMTIHPTTTTQLQSDSWPSSSSTFSSHRASSSASSLLNANRKRNSALFPSLESGKNTRGRTHREGNDSAVMFGSVSDGVRKAFHLSSTKGRRTNPAKEQKRGWRESDYVQNNVEKDIAVGNSSPRFGVGDEVDILQEDRRDEMDQLSDDEDRVVIESILDLGRDRRENGFNGSFIGLDASIQICREQRKLIQTQSDQNIYLHQRVARLTEKLRESEKQNRKLKKQSEFAHFLAARTFSSSPSTSSPILSLSFSAPLPSSLKEH